MADKILPDTILDQNTELGIEPNCIHKVFKPILKPVPGIVRQ